MDALSKKMGGVVSKQAISKYEAAKMMPTSTILIAMAEALTVELDYFLRPFSFDVDNLEVSFRKKSSVGAKDVSALIVQNQDEIERSLEVKEVWGRETPKVCDIDVPKIKTSFGLPMQSVLAVSGMQTKC